MAVVLVIAALIVVGGGVYLLFGGSDEPTTSVRTERPAGSARSTRTTAAARRQATERVTPAPDHGQIRVAVLNGTGVTGLAGRLMATLTADGFPDGPVGDASSTNRASTAVSYRAGGEAAAREVARALGLSTDAVTEIDTDTETAACVLQTPCTVEVVVTVGADRSQ